MKKLIILLVIGSMFVFVSVQCALTNNNKETYNAQYQIKNAGSVIQTEKPESELSAEIKKSTTDTEIIKESEDSETILSD